MTATLYGAMVLDLPSGSNVLMFLQLPFRAPWHLVYLAVTFVTMTAALYGVMVLELPYSNNCLMKVTTYLGCHGTWFVLQ
jgi:hypothetical protein